MGLRLSSAESRRKAKVDRTNEIESNQPMRMLMRMRSVGPRMMMEDGRAGLDA